MSRSRTATSILEARGAFKRHPERKRENEPVVKSAFPSVVPNHLTDEESECWTEIVGLCPSGVLTGADTIAVEVLAGYLVEWREKGVDMNSTHMTKMLMMVSKLGLDPSGRASLVVEKTVKNEFDDL